jgi:hypothetical protein
MTRKGEAHKTLSLLYQRDGAPQTMAFEVQKNNPWVGSGISSVRQTAMQARQSPIPCGSKLLKVASTN